MVEKYGRATTGIVLIVVGILALLASLGFGEIFGEAIPALVGVFFLILYAVGRANWALYPGAFTTPVGVVTFLAARGTNMELWWPLFVAAPGFGFLIIRLAKPWNRWAIYPAAVLILLAGVFFTFSSHALRWLYVDFAGKLWPVLLILLGLMLILRSFRRGNSGGNRGPDS
jgi:hypothetical protein